MSERCRVLYLEPSALVTGGSIALLRLVQALDRRRFAPFVVLGSRGPLVAEFRRVPGCRVFVRPFPARLAEVTRNGIFLGGLKSSAALVRYAAALSALVRRLRPRICHTNGLKMHLLSVVLRRRDRGALIWHLRDLISPPYLPRRTAILVRSLARVVPDAVICNSRATSETIEQRISGRLHCVPDGLLLEHHPERTDRASRDSRVAILGRVARWKGQDVFVAAALRLRPRFGDVRFIVAGTATTREDLAFLHEITAHVAGCGAGRQIVLAGLVRNVPKLLSEIDVLVHCSVSPEPFGQVVIEGMAAGLPVVASREGGPAEIITDGKTGFLYAPGNVEELVAILDRLLTHPRDRERAGKEARAEVARFYTIERTARATEAIYDRVLLGPRPRRLLGTAAAG